MKKTVSILLIAGGAVCALAQSAPLTLPFADSFAGAAIDASKWEKQTVEGETSNLWLPTTTVASGKSDAVSYGAVDGDGGFVYCNFYQTRDGNNARLATLPIDVASSTSPVVDFYIWRSGLVYNGEPDAIKLQVQADDGEWQDVPDAVYKNLPDADGFDAENAAEGWYNYKVGVGDLIPAGSSTFRVGFLSAAQWGYNMALDNVNIYNLTNADLMIESVDAPATVIAGNDIELAVTVINMGQAVEAGDYFVAVDSDYPVQLMAESVAIPAAGRVKIIARAPLTAEEAFDTPEYSFTPKVIFEGDENPDNNVGDEVTVKTAFSIGGRPSNFKVTMTGEDVKELNFTWDSEGEAGYVPVNISEDFESLDVDTTGEFNGWMSYDFDNAPGDYYYNVDSPEFIVTTAGAGAVPGNARGKFLGVTIAANAQQDDWLVSPQLNCKEQSELTFSARIACKEVSSNSHSVSCEVLYCTDEEYDTENMTASFRHQLESYTSKVDGITGLSSDNTFRTVTIKEIPSEARYIALHFKTRNTVPMAMWVDELKIYEDDTNPLVGYNVYERERGRLNDEVVTDTEYSVIDRAREENKRYFYLTAVYADGESNPSDLASTVITAVEDIIEAGGAIAPVNGGVMVSGFAGERVEVFTLDGRRAASMRCGEISVVNLAAGVYVVKVADRVEKVVVR